MMTRRWTVKVFKPNRAVMFFISAPDPLAALSLAEQEGKRVLGEEMTGVEVLEYVNPMELANEERTVFMKIMAQANQEGLGGGTVQTA